MTELNKQKITSKKRHIVKEIISRLFARFLDF